MPKKGKKQRKSALEDYCGRVQTGEVVACKTLKKICSRLLREIEYGYKQWHFDRDAAERPVNFIEQFCFIPTGKLGKPFILEDYERAWVEAIFGFVDDDGNRRFREVFIEVGRKNGKTSLVAAIELYMLIADGEGAPQIYNAATTQAQAELAFNACNRMRRQSQLIARHVTKRTDSLSCDLNMGYIRPLAANTSHLDGLDVHCGVLDEIHAMTTRDIYDLIRQGMAAREQPLLIQITTNGFTRNGIFDEQLAYAKKWVDGTLDDDNADRFLAFIYELDDREEWESETSWLKANPGLGTVKSWDFMRQNYAKAKHDPSFRPTFLTKDLDMPENASVAWLTFDEAVNRATYKFEDMGFRYGICGFDAADTVDLTSAQMIMMRPDDDHIYLKSMYWIPEDVILAYSESGKRRERDDAPYLKWIERGLMRTVKGNKVDKKVLIEWLQELKEEDDLWTYAVGFDPWHMDDSTVRELEAFVGASRVFRIRQGAMTLSQPMKQLRADYQAGRIVDNDNPLNQFCRMNVMVRQDVNGNLSPDKRNNNPKNRIDGFMAELDAYATLYRVYDDYMNVC